jgi:hypothetical protein
MKVTKKMIKELYCTQRVEQVGSKQLFTAYLPKLSTFVYISYRTIIGLKYGEEWLITNEWFSQTTTCHKYEIMKMENNARQVKQCYFKDKLDKLRLAN